jgi:hypothetical protein
MEGDPDGTLMGWSIPAPTPPSTGRNVGAPPPVRSDVTGHNPVMPDWRRSIGQRRTSALTALNVARDGWGTAHWWRSSFDHHPTHSPHHVAAGRGPQGEATRGHEGRDVAPRGPLAASTLSKVRGEGKAAWPRGWTGRRLPYTSYTPGPISLTICDSNVILILSIIYSFIYIWSCFYNTETGVSKIQFSLLNFSTFLQSSIDSKFFTLICCL